MRSDTSDWKRGRRVSIWKLRKNLTAYDAAYLALAQALGAELLTRDKRLAKAPDTGVRIIVP